MWCVAGGGRTAKQSVREEGPDFDAVLDGHELVELLLRQATWKRDAGRGRFGVVKDLLVEIFRIGGIVDLRPRSPCGPHPARRHTGPQWMPRSARAAPRTVLRAFAFWPALEVARGGPRPPKLRCVRAAAASPGRRFRSSRVPLRDVPVAAMTTTPSAASKMRFALYVAIVRDPPRGDARDSRGSRPTWRCTRTVHAHEQAPSKRARRERAARGGQRTGERARARVGGKRRPPNAPSRNASTGRTAQRGKNKEE